MANRAVILGASSGVGRALAEELARCHYHLVLVARHERDLAALASDLTLRWQIQAYIQPLDLQTPDLDIGGFCETCLTQLGSVDAVFLTAGMTDSDDVGPAEPPLIERLIRVNYARMIQFSAAFGRIFEAQGAGTLVTFSSISAAAPRSRNTVYSSTKAALDTYCKGLRHYFRDTSVIVQTYTLGYVDTAMTFGQKLLFPIASPAMVATYAVKNLHRDRGKIYLPRFWGIVVFVLRHTPWFLYKRLPF